MIYIVAIIIIVAIIVCKEKQLASRKYPCPKCSATIDPADGYCRCCGYVTEGVTYVPKL